MKEHAIPAGATHARKRVGRGEGNGRGKTCCRGENGAKSRSGYSLRPGFEGGQMPLFRKLPRRGFNNARFRKEYALVNIGELEKIQGNLVDLDSAKAAGIIRSNAISIKLLGKGEVNKPYTVKVCKCSTSAEEKIKAAGGSVEAIS
jgi:large subunit ribosomal protein L15